MSLKRSYNGIPVDELKQFLEEKYLQYNTPSFIESDPVSIPHSFISMHDREVSGFLAAAISWGRRDLILRSSRRLLEMMDNRPYEFIMNATGSDLSRVDGFVHRTFNGKDCIAFMKGLKMVYTRYHSMEEAIVEGMGKERSLAEGLANLRALFFSADHEKHAEKHFADVLSGSAGKRLFMFLRWMVRKDNKGVDFGIWTMINPSELFIPLDFHSGNTARKLGLLKRKMNDWKAVLELTSLLKEFDADDPVKYDFALFGLGVNERF